MKNNTCIIIFFINQSFPLSILLSATAIPTDHQINDALTGLSHKTASHFAIQQADQITHKYASARQQFCTRAIKVSGPQPASIWSAPGLTSGGWVCDSVVRWLKRQVCRQFGMLQCGNRYGSCGATAESAGA